MNIEENNHKKITFKYYSNFLEEEVIETMWCKIVDESKGIYKLDNIPFYGPLIASDDIFYAEFDEDVLVYKEVIESSGNSVVQVVILKENFDKEIIRKKVFDLGCESEGMNDNFFVIEIPKNINYTSIKKLLNEYENNKFIEYAEPCLSVKHQDDVIEINS
jgi:hypothetical protein